MIEILKAKEYKGIKEIVIHRIGHINVLCGKNNSGKTSIFEALANPKTHAIGQQVTEPNRLNDIFAPQANGYSSPNPHVSKEWFKRLVDNWIDSSQVWFSDENDVFRDAMLESQNSSRLSGHGNDTFNHSTILELFFQPLVSSFEPLYIPPKRIFPTSCKLNFAEDFGNDGQGLLNHLFYLKSQDLHSESYKKYKKIYTVFNKITGLTFNIFPNNDNVLSLCFGSDGNWLPANDCGLGLSEALILTSLIVSKEASFIFIEEPENHLHAKYQKNFLTVLSEIKSKQFFLSTHSSVFLDPNNVDSIYTTMFNNEISVSNETSKSEIISSLGYSVADNLVSDVIILTEGPSDIKILKILFNKYGTMKNFNMRFWPLGGDIMAYLDLSVFKESNNIFALIDKDPSSSKARTRFSRNCKDLNIHCTKLKRYSIENYCTLSALKTLLGDTIPKRIKTIDPSLKLDDQLGLSKKGKSVKSRIHQVFELMSLDDLANTDLLKFIETVDSFLHKD